MILVRDQVRNMLGGERERGGGGGAKLHPEN
jgi:hypothetical protein